MDLPSGVMPTIDFFSLFNFEVFGPKNQKLFSKVS